MKALFSRRQIRLHISTKLPSFLFNFAIIFHESEIETSKSTPTMMMFILKMSTSSELFHCFHFVSNFLKFNDTFSILKTLQRQINSKWKPQFNGLTTKNGYTRVRKISSEKIFTRNRHYHDTTRIHSLMFNLSLLFTIKSIENKLTQSLFSQSCLQSRLINKWETISGFWWRNKLLSNSNDNTLVCRLL